MTLRRAGYNAALEDLSIALADELERLEVESLLPEPWPGWSGGSEIPGLRRALAVIEGLRLAESLS